MGRQTSWSVCSDTLATGSNMVRGVTPELTRWPDGSLVECGLANKVVLEFPDADKEK